MKNLLCLLLIVSFVVLVLFLCLGDLENIVTTALTRNDKNNAELAISSFIIMASDIVLPIPSAFIMIINGSLFGVFYGTMLSITSNLVSCSLGFVIGRKCKPLISRLSSEEELISARSFIDRFGFYGLIISRGIPILAEAVTIVSGAGGITWQRFIMACFFGLIPISFVYAYTGHLALDGHYGLLISVFINAIIIALLWTFKQRFISTKNST